jgi:hypothetical protein
VDVPHCSVMATTPPTRRRRMITYIVLIVVLVTGVGWWLSQPPVDSRFVGRWIHRIPDSEWPSPISELHADGTGMNWIPADRQGTSYQSYGIDWSVHNNRLICRPHQKGVKATLRATFDRLRSKLTSSRTSGLKITEVSDNEIHFEDDSVDGTISLIVFRRSDQATPSPSTPSRARESQ